MKWFKGKQGVLKAERCYFGFFGGAQGRGRERYLSYLGGCLGAANVIQKRIKEPKE